jgi:DNA-binding HxlR family transcriptional regulator
MFGRLMRFGGYHVLEALKNGPVKISQLRSSVPLYGSAFDFVLSQLMLAGLVRRFEKDGEEYAELTDLAKSFPYYGGYGPFYGHYHHGHHGWW